ncbi:MAG: restriction endonuclease [Chloroflexota bacterium]|nr:restriction endonuclease [Chloroflexota bacterium]
MDDKEYEATTAALYQALGEVSGVTVDCFGSRCRLQGKSGSWYQIDVLLRQSNGLQTVRTAIECKHWGKRVTRNVVSNLITLLEDTDIEKGVVVSKEGFTSGAVSLAKERNISLVEMREPNDADWEGKIKTIRLIVHRMWPEFYDFEFVQPQQPGAERRQVAASGQEILIIEPNNEPRTLVEVANDAASSVTSSGQEVEVRFRTGTTMRISGVDKQATIEALRFKVKLRFDETELVVDGAEAIRLIVKEIFEERQLNIGLDGQVSEVTDGPDPSFPGNE